MKKLLTERDILSSIAYWGVAQDPYNNPIKLDVVLGKMKEMVRQDFKEDCTEFYCKEFDLKDLESWLSEKLMSIPEFVNWNLSRNEIKAEIKVDNEDRPKYSFSSAYWGPVKDDDFIDLYACIRNICIMLKKINI